MTLAFGYTAPTELVDQLYEMRDDGIDAVRVKICEAKKKADEAIDLGSAGSTSARQAARPAPGRDQHRAAGPLPE